MSKEYSEALEKMCCATLEEDLSVRDIYENEYGIVEQALQRLEAIDNANPSEAMEELDKLERCADSIRELPMSNWLDLAENETQLELEILKWVSNIKKALKVLNVIKEKNVDTYCLKTCISLEHYNSEMRLKNQNNTYSYEIWYELTEEEFDLLKRWLG